MASFLQRLSGNLYLGYRAVVAHPLRKLFRRDERTGIERFLANYGVEGLLPTSNDERRLREGAARCIACGLCDAFGARVSLVPLSYARATPDLRHAHAELEALPPSAVEKGEQVCPTRVPLRALTDSLRATLRALRS